MVRYTAPRRPDRDVERFADADRDNALSGRIVADMVVFGHIFADRPAQRRIAEVGGVAGMPLFQRKDPGFADRPRRGEVGFADAETDHVVHGVDQVENFTDAALGQFADMIRDQISTDTL